MKAGIPILALTASLLTASLGQAADLRVMSGGAPREALASLTPEFERVSGHTVTFTYAVVTAMQQRLAAGEKTDMVLMPVPVIDDLVKTGRLRAENRATLGVLGISLIVRHDAKRPDISTPDRFRKALLDARSIVHSTPTATPSGAHMARVLDELGITAEVAKKVIHRPALDGGAELVARGEAELGIYPTSEVAHVEGVDIVGPLPSALQLKIVYGAAVTNDSAAPEPAASFIKFLSERSNRTYWKGAGFDPPGAS